MTTDAVLETIELGAPPWPTIDPFLFCVHHHDAYPAGNDRLGPDDSLTGRDLGQDFSGRDGWNMYHGQVVAGFPQHPHRGFETVTYVRAGTVDHSDSLGAAARFGAGDTQWLTAGEGIVHSEMFPLLDRTGPNPLELFQIWLNLPAADKLAEPHFTMLWDADIPRQSTTDADGRCVEVTVIAGQIEGMDAPPPPPPKSWASRADAEVAIWHIALDGGARWTLPAASSADIVRTLYVFEGTTIDVGGHDVVAPIGVVVRSDIPVRLTAGPDRVQCLVLQGRPIGEPVAQYGPFVMNERHEIQQAIEDYRRTGFGGWPWSTDDPDHGPDRDRFADHTRVSTMTVEVNSTAP